MFCFVFLAPYARTTRYEEAFCLNAKNGLIIINEERTFNQIDSNRHFIMDRLEIYSICRKYTASGSIGKRRAALENL